MLCQFIIFILEFYMRKEFSSMLGEIYLGLDSTFSSVLIMISAIAAYTMLAAAGMASMSSKSQKAFNSILSAVGAKDGNDLFALLVAAGIKASLITTIAQTIETTAGSTGTGLLIPFGP